MTWLDWLVMDLIACPALLLLGFLMLLGGKRQRGYQPKQPITGPPPTPAGLYRDANWALKKRD